MKKIFAMLLALIMCLSLCACGDSGEKAEEKNEVELTVSNIKEYLKISSKVNECNFNKGSYGYVGAKGDAEIVIETINSSGAKFKNVTIKCEVWVGGGLNCGWEFEKDNNRCDEQNRQEYNYKVITIDLPSNGEASAINEALKWENYKGEWSDNMPVYDELSDTDIKIEIIEVSGKVIIED